MNTKEEILESNGFDIDTFKFNFENSAKNLLTAMEEYVEQQSDLVHDLFNKPAKKLEPLQELYRRENPRPCGEFYLPDRTKFYEWIVKKMS